MFHHERLTSLRSIRLLWLTEASEFEAPLQLKLSEVSLDDKVPLRPAYDALSYVWGSRMGTCSILCDGEELLVTPSCESALRHLRLEYKPRVLWIDAICIDQDSTVEALEERSTQVAMMGEVYASAEQTICWLGDGTAYTMAVMNCLERIGECPSQRGFRKLMDLELRLQSTGMLERTTSCLDPIFCHPWHSRVWTIQEAAFSKRCQVVCGASSISWESYVKAANFLIFEQYIDSLDFQASRNMVSIDMRNSIRNYILDIGETDSNGDENEIDEHDRQVTVLASCLADVNQLRATDAKDKIYGLHALYTSLGVPLPQVDYSKPIAVVYTEATIAMISWSSSLRVIADACSLNRATSLPSWVPDWDDAEARMYMPRGNVSEAATIFQVTLETFSPATGKLRVNGRIVGRVLGNANDAFMIPFPTRSSPGCPNIFSGSGYSFGTDIDFLRLMIDKVRFFRELIQLIESHRKVFQYEELEDVFHEFVTLGKRDVRDDLMEILLDILSYPDGEYEQAFGEALAAEWKLEDSQNAHYWDSELLICCTIIASLLTKSITFEQVTVPSQEELLDLFKNVSETLGDHTVIFVHSTSGDRYAFGTTFCTVKEGDAVVLLDGAEWAVVLRPAGNALSEWLFIGPAYFVESHEIHLWHEKDGSQAHLKQHFVLI